MQKSNWTVPRMWQNRDVYIIGGGSSVPLQFGVPEDIIRKVEKGELPVSVYSPYMKAIHDKPVIGVNMAFKLGDWIDICFFGDKSFYDKNGIEKELEEFKGLKVGGHRFYNSDAMKEKGIHCLLRSKKRYGISDTPDTICWNGNSGAAAISIAVHAGAKRIILIGFDMYVSKTHSHWHNLYGKSKTPPFKNHMKGFSQIAQDAEKIGVEIYNVSLHSSIPHFPKVKIDDILNDKKIVTVDTNIERSIGVLDKYNTLKKIHDIIDPNFYLEIGTKRGTSLKLSNAPLSIGIDSNPKIGGLKGKELVKKNSNQFFKHRKLDQKIDLAFIDGKHLIENVLSDFINVEKNSHKNGVIVLDDPLPAHPVQANRIKQSNKWTGDVWKIVPILRKYRPDLTLKLLDVAPTGMLVVTNLDPSNSELESNYKTIVDQWKNEIVPLDITDREKQEVSKNLNFLSPTKKNDHKIKVITPSNTEDKNDFKIGVVTPTRSSERKPFLDFLEKRIYGQTKQVDKWYLVDYPNNTQTPDLSKRYKKGITKAIEDKCNLIFFMEDDDYYPYTYIEELFEEWEKNGRPTIIGVADTIYFHLKHDKFALFSQKNRTSAFETAITPNAVYDQFSDDIINYDIKLWKANQPGGVLVEIPNRPIGIKHGIGLIGGSYHTESKYKTDTSHMKLEDFVDEEAYNFYQKIKEKL
ncbi:MAG: class I SAM-dependent methyltransferase [Bacteroidales bacterium]